MRATATERALDVEGGVFLACNEYTGENLWPRCLYRSAEDALQADASLTGDDYTEGMTVRLTWAVRDHREFGWWRWGSSFRESWESVECWVVEA